jgi:glycosyltransferase involved in cell wall biosynthesis
MCSALRPQANSEPSVRIALVTHSISRNAGGLFQCVRRLAQMLDETPGITVEVLAVEDELSSADLPAWGPLKPHCHTALGPRALGYAPDLAATLRELDPDITDANGIWTYPSLVCRRRTRRTRRPHVITPHGMLDPWALNNSRWKKALAGWLYENAHLREAQCLRALTLGEARAFRAFGLRNPICLVPNGVDLPSTSATRTPSWRESIPEGRSILLYLGRIHPKKNLVALIQAWKRVRASAERQGWCLVVAGWDQVGHASQLSALVDELSLGGTVHLVGPQFDLDKEATFCASDAFILPSLSEGHPVAVLEAWSYGLPVLMTPQCNLQEGFAMGAAIELQPETSSIADALQALFRMPAAEREEIGRRGRRLVEDRFSWDRIVAEMSSVYAWLSGGGSPPTSVMAGGDQA